MTHSQICTHCQQEIIDIPLSNERGDTFCCVGCQAVNEILTHKGWDKYYELMQASQKQAPTNKSDTSYSNQVSLWAKGQAFVQWGKWEDSLHTLTLRSAGISCSACGWLIEKALGETEGIRKVRVDFVKGYVFLQYDSLLVGLDKILLLCAKLGYRLHPVNSDQTSSPPSPYLPRLALAAAVFMNVMAFAYAEYFDLLGQMEPVWRKFFQYVSLILTLPVVTYCAWPFYQHAFQGLKHKTLHMDLPISLGLLTAYFYSIWLVIEGGKYPFFDGVAGLSFFLLAGRWAVDRWERGIALAPHIPESLSDQSLWLIKKNEKPLYTSAAQAQVGDLVLIAPGELVPLDGLLESDQGLFDTSLLSGESKPSLKPQGSYVSSGFRNLRYEIALRVTRSEKLSRTQTLLKQLAELRLLSQRQRSKGEAIVPYFIFLVLTGALAGFVWHLPQGLDQALRIGISLLILTCSCTLALSAPLTTAAVYARCEKNGIFLLRDSSLYTWNKIKAVVLDKTGTLSFSERQVESWQWLGEPPLDPTLSRQLIASLSKQSLHPVSLSLTNFLADYTTPNHSLEDYQESIHFGISGKFTAYPERWFIGKAEANATPPPPDLEIYYQIPYPESYTYKDRRADVCIWFKGQRLALVWFKDEIRPAASLLIEEWKRRKLHIALFSGDSPDRTHHMGKLLGITDCRGAMSPEDKAQGLKELQSTRGKTLAIGDGFNDALLLGSADVSLAVGKPGVLLRDVDAYLVRGDFSPLLWLDKILNKVPQVRLCAYCVSALYNILAFILAWQGYIAPLVGAILMPLSTLSLLFIVSLGTRIKAPSLPHK